MQAKHALIVGVDKYGNLDPKYELSGCVNDAKLMKSILVDHFRFDESSITSLHNEDASQDGILAQMNRLADDVGKDDIVLFHYSGHGSTRTSADPSEASGMDSTIMPTDSGRHPKPNLDISDKDINAWLERLTRKTRNITLIFDCCHSGTITRDAFGGKVRAVEDDNRSLEEMGIDPANVPKPTKAATREVGPSGWLTLSDAYVVMSGCRDDECSYEYTDVDGGEEITNGALTYFLTNALTRAKPGTTYRDVFELARQQVNATYPAQNPQIEGTQDREIFGTKDIEPLRFIPVAAVTGDRLTLNGGAAHGLHSQSRWAVYPQGTKKTEGADLLGLIEIESVGPLTAEAVIRESHGDIIAGSRCVEKTPSVGKYQLKIDLSLLPADQCVALRSAVDESDLLTLAETVEAADVRAYVLEARDSASAGDPVPQVDRIETQTWALVDREGELAMPLHAVSEQDVVKTLVSNLEAIARYRNALGLDNPDSDLSVDFNIYRGSSEGEWELANGGDCVFDDGDCLAFELVNREDKPVFLSVLDFGLTGKIELVYPHKKASEMVAAGRTVELGKGKKKFHLTVPDAFPADRGKETLKAFVTTEEADFTWLQQQGTRSAGTRSQLRKQFEAAYNGPATRELNPEGEDDEDQAWKAIGRSFELRRREI